MSGHGSNFHTSTWEWMWSRSRTPPRTPQCRGWGWWPGRCSRVGSLATAPWWPRQPDKWRPHLNIYSISVTLYHLIGKCWQLLGFGWASPLLPLPKRPDLSICPASRSWSWPRHACCKYNFLCKFRLLKLESGDSDSAFSFTAQWRHLVSWFTA